MRKSSARPEQPQSKIQKSFVSLCATLRWHQRRMLRSISSVPRFVLLPTFHAVGCVMVKANQNDFEAAIFEMGAMCKSSVGRISMLSQLAMNEMERLRRLSIAAADGAQHA